MRNPFTLGIAAGEDFCNREKELKELLNYARNGQKVVFYSPRRYGKSSLIGQVHETLSKEGYFVVYADLFSVTSETDFLSKFATAVFKGIGRGADPRTWIEKAVNIFKRFVPSVEFGSDGAAFSVRFDRTDHPDLLLDDLMEGIRSYTLRKKLKACITLDEFQEITELKESKKIEGTLRSYIQRHKEIAYFFVGSRRRILTDMFTDKSRPFYKSAFLYTFAEIPKDAFAPYITDRFNKTGKTCALKSSGEIYDLVRGNPYYVQKLSSLCWDQTQKACNSGIVRKSYHTLINIESAEFEGIWGGLALAQKTLLKAIAKEPASAIFSKAYLERHKLSVGGVQKAVKYLIRRDLVEKEKGSYKITDPVFGAWLSVQ
ncbi:MAG: ATP-binding protein [Bacteroidota bacterium]